MNTTKLTIGQMARLNHVTEQTLRLYDKKGLLKPSYIDHTNGYRFYDVRQSSRLDIIKTLQTYGMTLREIKSHLKKGVEPDLKKLLKEQKKKIQKRLEKLRDIEAQIDVRLDNIERYEILRNTDTSFLQYVPERCIYRYSTKMDYFNFENGTIYELMLRELKDHMDDKGIPLIFFHNIGTVIREENIKKGKLSTSEVFILVNDDKGMLDIDTMPGGMYFCRCSSDMDAEAELAEELMREIDEKRYEVCGDYYCEVIHELPSMTEEHRKIFYMIQIPVKNRDGCRHRNAELS